MIFAKVVKVEGENSKGEKCFRCAGFVVSMSRRNSNIELVWMQTTFGSSAFDCLVVWCLTTETSATFATSETFLYLFNLLNVLNLLNSLNN